MPNSDAYVQYQIANSGQKGNRFSGADRSHLSTRRGVRFFPSFFPGLERVERALLLFGTVIPEDQTASGEEIVEAVVNAFH